MLCKRCMTVMGAGTTYEKRRGDSKPSARRFHECKKCQDKVYTKEHNFQECMSKATEKNKKDINLREVYQYGTDINHILY